MKSKGTLVLIIVIIIISDYTKKMTAQTEIYIEKKNLIYLSRVYGKFCFFYIKKNETFWATTKHIVGYCFCFGFLIVRRSLPYCICAVYFECRVAQKELSINPDMGIRNSAKFISCNLHSPAKWLIVVI